MDTRRSPGHGREEPAGYELGTDTVAVELVDLTPVSRADGSRAWRAPIIGGIVVVAVLAAIALGGELPFPTPSESAVPQSTTPPVATVATSARPSTPPRPTTAPTARPTPPPDWQWTQSEYFLDSGIADEGAWGVNGAVLVPAYLYSSDVEGFAWGIARLTEDGMDVFEAPPAITELWGGSVVGDRLWFLAKVSGVTAGQATWQFVSTADGQAWESLGAAEGLEQVAAASFIGRVGGTWIAGFWPKDGGGSGAPTPTSLMWSADGVEWLAADVPDGPGVLQLGGAARLGETFVVVGSRWESFESVSYLVLTSGDGRSWQETPLQVPAGRYPDELVCGHGQCLLTVAPIEDGERSPTQVLLTSSNAVAWREAAIDVPHDYAGSQLRELQVTSSGFIASTYGEPAAWLSEDGRSWWRLEVLPPGAAGPFKHLVVARDLVVGLVEGENSDLPSWIWRGSLASVMAAPR